MNANTEGQCRRWPWNAGVPLQRPWRGMATNGLVLMTDSTAQRTVSILSNLYWAQWWNVFHVLVPCFPKDFYSSASLTEPIITTVEFLDPTLPAAWRLLRTNSWALSPVSLDASPEGSTVHQSKHCSAARQPWIWSDSSTNRLDSSEGIDVFEPCSKMKWGGGGSNRTMLWDYHED